MSPLQWKDVQNGSHACHVHYAQFPALEVFYLKTRAYLLFTELHDSVHLGLRAWPNAQRTRICA